jgi:hypothetical protein
MTATNIFKGMVGGFIGTIVLSAIMIMKTMMNVMPEFDMIGMMAGMLNGSRTTAWVVHFIIGTVLWGGLFAWLDPYIPTQSHWSKGTWFGVGAWIVMMVTLMPMAGAGLFAVKLGMMVTAATLILHAIFGAVMGAVYGVEHPERSYRYEDAPR